MFGQPGLAYYFVGGIYGSPKDKHSIVADLLKIGQRQRPALFLGDSRVGHEVAKTFDFDFVFVSPWTEFNECQIYCCLKGIAAEKSLSDVIDIVDLKQG